MNKKLAVIDVWDSLAPDLIGVEIDGSLVFINSAGARMLGAESPEQLVGKCMTDIVHPDYHQLMAWRTQQLESEGSEAPLCEEKWVRLNGTVIDVKVSAICIKYANRLATHFVVRDVTPRSRAEFHSQREDAIQVVRPLRLALV